MPPTLPIVQKIQPPGSKAGSAAAPEFKKPPKTTGEKWFDALRFVTGEGIILGLTAAVAYIASPKYGKDAYGPIPNVFKKMQQWVLQKLMPEAAHLAQPLSKSDQFKVRFAGAVASTTVLMHGGNLFVPVMKALQDHKAHIVTYFNERVGKPGEVEAGKERLKHETKETWGDIIKGRIGSWFIVFTSFIAADTLAGKDAKGQYRFDKFEEKFGRMLAGLTKSGKDISRIPVHEALSEVQAANRTYRIGKILALDIYATTAAIGIWTTISKVSAIARGKKERAREEAIVEKVIAKEVALESTPLIVKDDVKPVADMTLPLAQSKSHTVRITGPNADYRALVQKQSATSGNSLS